MLARRPHFSTTAAKIDSVMEMTASGIETQGQIKKVWARLGRFE